MNKDLQCVFLLRLYWIVNQNIQCVFFSWDYIEQWIKICAVLVWPCVVNRTLNSKNQLVLWWKQTQQKEKAGNATSLDKRKKGCTDWRVAASIVAACWLIEACMTTVSAISFVGGAPQREGNLRHRAGDDGAVPAADQGARQPALWAPAEQRRRPVPAVPAHWAGQRGYQTIHQVRGAGKWTFEMFLLLSFLPPLLPPHFSFLCFLLLCSVDLDVAFWWGIAEERTSKEINKCFWLFSVRVFSWEYVKIMHEAGSLWVRPSRIKKWTWDTWYKQPSWMHAGRMKARQVLMSLWM